MTIQEAIKIIHLIAFPNFGIMIEWKKNAIFVKRNTNSILSIPKSNKKGVSFVVDCANKKEGNLIQIRGTKERLLHYEENAIIVPSSIVKLPFIKNTTKFFVQDIIGILRNIEKYCGAILDQLLRHLVVESDIVKRVLFGEMEFLKGIIGLAKSVVREELNLKQTIIQLLSRRFLERIKSKHSHKQCDVRHFGEQQMVALYV